MSRVGASIYGAQDNAPGKQIPHQPPYQIKTSVKAGFYIIYDCTSMIEGAMNGRPYRPLFVLFVIFVVIIVFYDLSFLTTDH